MKKSLTDEENINILTPRHTQMFTLMGIVRLCKKEMSNECREGMLA